MSDKKKLIALAIGTRPEAIKLAPLYYELKKSDIYTPIILATGQHNEMLLQTLDAFDIKPEINLELMTQCQTLSSLTSKIIKNAESVLQKYEPKFVIVQGDTTTALSIALSCFYQKISVCHLEAGLRTDTKLSPYPEEMNRRLVTQIADYHFAPTTWAYNNLIKENIDKDKILLSGNTVIDALSYMIAKVKNCPPDLSPEITKKLNSNKKIVLITGHRRENFGQGFEDLCNAIKILSEKFIDHEFIYPVHLNPNVQEPVNRILSNLPNVLLTEPLDYTPFVFIMSKSYLLLSDSGGIQEEAPHLGKPVLVMRESTERPEAIEAGTALLVGTDQNSIIENVSRLLTDTKVYATMSTAKNPYGDGDSSQKITKFLEKLD